MLFLAVSGQGQFSAMIRSMTGYGTGSSQVEGTAAHVEVRTVNHRFLDLHIRIPKEYSALESEVQQATRGLLTRGRVDVTVNIQCTRSAEFHIDTGVIRNYLEVTQKLREEHRLDGSLDLNTLLTLPGVIQSKDSLPADSVDQRVSEVVQKSLREALDSVVRMRCREGATLEADLVRHLAAIRENADRVQAVASSVPGEFRRRLEERLSQALPQGVIDPQRLAQEVAFLAEKCDISEEVTRLNCHLDQFDRWVQKGQDEIGKKMDFLLQEMQREANTILSKTGHIDITRSAITIKAEIEKLREQVQNIE
jgi:uncharacterized protein (TIGR00255 family)